MRRTPFSLFARRALRVLGPLILLSPALVGPMAAPAVGADWAWPIPDPHLVVREWRAPADDYSAGHRGIDIAAPIGASVFAPESGTVRFAGRVVDRPVLSIEHPGGLISSYEPVETTLKKGDQVARGQRIGTVGSASASHCAESCLHLGVRRDGRYLSPMLVLEPAARAILLPVAAADRLIEKSSGRMPRVTPAGAPGGRSPAASRSSRECRSGSCRGSRARASPARHAGRRRRRADAWRPCV